MNTLIVILLLFATSMLACDHGDVVEQSVLTPHGWQQIKLDRCIAPLVNSLNKGGIATISSCCGHGDPAAGYILCQGFLLKVHQSRKQEDVIREYFKHYDEKSRDFAGQ